MVVMDDNIAELFLKDVFWEVRAKWYLLGIQLDVEHSDLSVS